jgi:hypothetical protein
MHCPLDANESRPDLQVGPDASYLGGGRRKESRIARDGKDGYQMMLIKVGS